MGTILALLIALFGCIIAIIVANSSSNPLPEEVDKILKFICFCFLCAIIWFAVVKKDDNQNPSQIPTNVTSSEDNPDASEDESEFGEDNSDVLKDESNTAEDVSDSSINYTNSSEDNSDATKDETSPLEDDGIPINQLPASPMECCEMRESITDLYGNTYHDNILMMDASNNALVSFDLGGSFSSFDGYLVCSTETGDEVAINVGIFADGRLLEKVTDFNKAHRPKKISVNLSNVNNLSIKTSNDGNYPFGHVFFVNSFFRMGKKTDVKQYNRLKDLFLIDSNNYDSRTILSKDSYGNLYDGCEMLDASLNAMVLYNLDNRFDSFSGSIVCLPVTGSGADMTLEIYVDNVKVYSKSGIKKQNKKIDFDISVKGGSTLKILTSNQGEYPYGHLAIVNDFLVP